MRVGKANAEEAARIILGLAETQAEELQVGLISAGFPLALVTPAVVILTEGHQACLLDSELILAELREVWAWRSSPTRAAWMKAIDGALKNIMPKLEALALAHMEEN